MKNVESRATTAITAIRENRGLSLLGAALGGIFVSVALVQTQGRGGGEWTTAGSDAQRTGWVRSDARLTREAVAKGEFQFLWKHRFDNEVRQLNSLTQPVLLDRLIGFRGFKALGFVGGSADRIFAIDTDLARPYWTAHLNYTATTGGPPPSSWACPGGLIATPTRRTVLAVSAFAGGGGGGRGGRSGSAVGEPGRGAAVLAQMATAQAQGRGRGAAAAPPQPQPAGRVNAATAPIPFGGVDPVYAVGSDGYLHTLLSSNGADSERAIPFLPPSSKPSALIFVDGVVYASTSEGCGAAPNAVWALDLAAEGADRKAVSWQTGGPSVAGSSGPAFGTDGTLYVALSASSDPRKAAGATNDRPDRYANAVVALDRRTLTVKDWFTADGADFNASPIVIRYKDKDLVAATANDGRLYLLDGASLGGSDHKTPLFATAKFSKPGAGTALATWESENTRWILATASGVPPASLKLAANGPVVSGAVVAFKLADQGGKITLEPGWVSRDMTAPLAPIVVNGMVFAASSGEFRGAGGLAASERAARSVPAVLYALDAATGKTIWSSGRTMTSFARSGLAAGAGQVYVVTYDNTLYAFGIPMEH
jgi:outer membrane protein assembly factor BamB